MGECWVYTPRVDVSDVPPRFGLCRVRSVVDIGLRKPLGGGSEPSKIPYRFAPVPIDTASDASLSDGAFRALAVMIGTRNGDRCRISQRDLGERLHRSERTAHAYIHELIHAGYIERIDAKNGDCGTYRIVALTPETRVSVRIGRPKANPQRAYGAPEYLFSGTCENGFSHPRYVDISLENDKSERKKNSRSLRDALLLELKRCNLNGTAAEKEAERLIRRFPGLVHLLSCHLRCALDAGIRPH